MKSKKVLFVATVTSHINTFHIPYLKLFKEQGYEVHVASKGEKEIEYCDKHYNLNFARFPFKLQNYEVYKALEKIINENNYEVIHCHTPVGGVLTRLASKQARKKGTKVIYTAHGFHFYKGAPLINWMMYYPLEKWLSRHTDCLITINNEDYNLAKKKFKKCKQVEHINGVGIDTTRFNIEISEEDLENFKKQIEISEKDIVLSYVAELNKNKNQLLLIQILERLLKENDRYKLILVGEGNKRKEYEQYVKTHKLENNVKFLGKRNDVCQILKITDIYVASSIREGLPLNILEAMYMGLPIIAIDNRGHRNLIETEENGYLVKNKNEFIKRIEQIMETDDLRKKFLKNNIKKIDKYTLSNIIKKMKEIYSKL